MGQSIPGSCPWFLYYRATNHIPHWYCTIFCRFFYMIVVVVVVVVVVVADPKN